MTNPNAVEHAVRPKSAAIASSAASRPHGYSENRSAVAAISR